MKIVGIDVGNQTAKAVILEGDTIIAHDCMVISGGVAKASETILQRVLEKAGLRREDVDYVVATGIGKEDVPFAQSRESEIACHARGAQFLFPSVRTIIDMGAENCRASKCSEAGKLLDFAMNDKCASGTGVFLETMAKLMEVPLEAIGSMALKGTEAVSISTMCAVFAESEVISEVHKGTKMVDISRGLCDSVALKTHSLLKRVGVEKDVIMTGGVARNIGVVDSISRLIGEEVLVPEEPQITGALGAALLLREKIGEKA